MVFKTCHHTTGPDGSPRSDAGRAEKSTLDSGQGTANRKWSEELERGKEIRREQCRREEEKSLVPNSQEKVVSGRKRWLPTLNAAVRANNRRMEKGPLEWE